VNCVRRTLSVPYANFDGNVAVQASIASPVHLTHPALADGSEDFIGAEAGARYEGQTAVDYTGL